MILLEIPMQTFDIELDKLRAAAEEEDVDESYIQGAVDALMWLRNGVPAPSERARA